MQDEAASDREAPSSSDALEPEFLPELVGPATEPLFRFRKAASELSEFILFISWLAETADKGRTTLVKAMYGPEDQELQEHDERLVRSRLRRFQPLYAEMLLVRSVENFLCYVSELLTLVFETRPETLRSSEQVQVSFVLEHANIEELVHSLVERRVERLAYQGLPELAGDLEQRLGFSLIPDPGRLTAAVELIEKRNLVVHNRSVINKRYRSRVTESPALGAKLQLSGELVDGLMLLHDCAIDVDRRAIEKWQLPATQSDGPLDETDGSKAADRGGRADSVPH